MPKRCFLKKKLGHDDLNFVFCYAVLDSVYSTVHLNRVPYLALAKTFEEIERVSARFELRTMITFFDQGFFVSFSAINF